MKKFYSLLALVLCSLTAGAQTLQFLVKGEPVENGARIDIAPYLDTDNPFAPEYNPELTVKSTVSGAAEATVVFTSGECLPALDENTLETGGKLILKFCSFDGSCINCYVGDTKTKSGTLTAGEEAKMEIELAIQLGFDQAFDGLTTSADFTVSCKQGSEEVSVSFYLGDNAGLSSVTADTNAAKEYFDLQGRKVLNPANGGLYIVRQGSKVSKQIIR